jgi:hypothetical protein
MGYDPQDNRIKEITDDNTLQNFINNKPQFLFTVGEEVTVKGVRFKVHDIGEQRIILKPISAA